MKRKHAGAETRKHGCARCRKHKSKIRIYQTKIGRKYSLCDDCAKVRGLG